MTQTQKYQTILHQLSRVPASRMTEVQAFLDKIVKQKNETTQSFAGIWNDFKDDDFVSFQSELKLNREQIDKEFHARGNS